MKYKNVRMGVIMYTMHFTEIVYESFIETKLVEYLV